jgi:hypothetical protein
MRKLLIGFMRLFGYVPAEEARAADLAAIRRLGSEMDGSRCWICHERYVGLAQDCACTDLSR